MKLGEVSRALVGGALVYAAMAACSSSESGRTMSLQLPDGGTAGHEGAVGAGGAAGNGGELGDATADVHADVHVDGQAGGFLDALTDPVPDALADGPPVNGSRLQAKVRVADDGAREKIPGVWSDSKLGVDCSFATATDGIERCLPIVVGKAQQLAIGFLDAGCTQRFVGPPASECPQVAPVFGFQSKLGPCGAVVWQVYKLGPLTAFTEFYSIPNCEQVLEPGKSVSLYPVTGEADPSEFVAAHAETEP